jgi:hypothetical protein
VAAAVVVVLLVAAGAVIRMRMSDDEKSTGATGKSGQASGQAGKAAQYLSAARALRYTGTFSSNGTSMQARLTVTKAGSGSGTITVAGDKADVIIVDGTTYLKASRTFWRSHGGVTTNPEDYAGRWSRAATSTLDLDVKDVLASGTIVRRLRAAGQSPVSDAEAVNGTASVKVTTADGEYQVAKAAPHKLLRIKASGTDTYQFDVAEVSAADTTALFTDLQQKVTSLTDALDPGIRFPRAGDLKFSNCGSAGCTVKYSVTSLSLNDESIRAVLKATIRANGRDLGTCTNRRSVGSSRRFDLSCTVTSSGWKAWVRWARSTPGSHSYQARARVLAESVSAADVNGLLAKLRQEQQSA